MKRTVIIAEEKPKCLPTVYQNLHSSEEFLTSPPTHLIPIFRLKHLLHS